MSTLIIKSEDLVHPKKLAFVKAIVGSEDEQIGRLIGVDYIGSKDYPFYTMFDNHKEFGVKISDIKLEPRLLIGEDVECFVFRDGHFVPFYVEPITLKNLGKFTNGWYTIRPSLTWLKENFEVVND
jgi:hypothetical protein